MADIFKNLFGKGSASPSPVPAADGDFADFAGAPDPSPASIIPSIVGSDAPAAASDSPAAASATGKLLVPYTKWYRIWERTSPSDFKQEAYLLPIILLIVLVHAWGTRTNRRKAKAWITAHAPVLESEFALVGFGGPKSSTGDHLLKEKTAQEFTTYATGRANVAFLDVKLDLFKRYNPMVWGAEAVLSMFFESIDMPVEKVEAVLYSFDGKERDLVPTGPESAEDQGKSSSSSSSSTYDPFVWAVVNKQAMRKLRDSRYDVSLTVTKDHAKLPSWATVMTESAEITEKLLTADLIKAIEKAGDRFQYLIVTDQPIDKPTKIDEIAPVKRIYLSTLFPSNNTHDSTLPLFNSFLRLPDHLASTAHFRPEVTRKVRNIREEEASKLRRADEEEKAEERKLAAEKAKKDLREKKLRGLSADEQKKLLEKEEEKKRRKSMKRMTRQG